MKEIQDDGSSTDITQSYDSIFTFQESTGMLKIEDFVTARNIEVLIQTSNFANSDPTTEGMLSEFISPSVLINIIEVYVPFFVEEEEE